MRGIDDLEMLWILPDALSIFPLAHLWVSYLKSTAGAPTNAVNLAFTDAATTVQQGWNT